LEDNYSGEKAYARSKLAMVMFTFELAERLKSQGIAANCLHPGSLLDTKMVRETSITPRGNAKTGAEAEVRLAVSPELEGVTGKYFEEKREAGAHPQAYDKDARNALWRLGERLGGMVS
jgi:NAD(P)-dependent dehydrogenase (short-subunit alcohol dehydrogenase family)